MNHGLKSKCKTTNIQEKQKIGPNLQNHEQGKQFLDLTTKAIKNKQTTDTHNNLREISRELC